MRRPPSVHVVLRPSRLLAAGIGTGAVASVALLFTLPLAAWQHTGMFAVLLGWAFMALRRDALRLGNTVVTELRLAPDLVVVACLGDGRLVAGHVRSATRVGAWLTSIVWRPDGARWSRSVLVVPDMLPEDDFRRLRVMLRYARSAAEQGSAASQA